MWERAGAGAGGRRSLTINGVFFVGVTLTLNGDDHVTLSWKSSHDAPFCFFLDTVVMASWNANGNNWMIRSRSQCRKNLILTWSMYANS